MLKASIDCSHWTGQDYRFGIARHLAGWRMGFWERMGKERRHASGGHFRSAVPDG